MSRPERFTDLERQVSVGGWKLEYNKEPHTQPIGRPLVGAILRLAARVPFDATKITRSLYDISATFDNGSAALFSFKPYSNDQYGPRPNDEVPQRRDEVDIRLFSYPFIGRHGATVQLATIVRSEDFRIEKENVLVGGRKIIHISPASSVDAPDWRSVDWENVENICPIQGNNIVPWLDTLGVSLDEEPSRKFEELATGLHLTA